MVSSGAQNKSMKQGSSMMTKSAFGIAIAAFLLSLGAVLWLVIDKAGGNTVQGGGGTVSPGSVVISDWRLYVNPQSPQYMHIQYTTDNGAQWVTVVSFDPDKKGVLVG